MIRQFIDRRRSTQGGMFLSFAIHAGLLVLLMTMVGQQVATALDTDELTEIAYIEARYGEDVAAQVKLKERPRGNPEPFGMGVSTESAVKPEPADDPKPEPPQPEARPALTAQPKLPEIETTPTRVEVAEVAAPTTRPQIEQQMLAAAPQLEVKQPQPTSRRVIDADKLKGALAPKALEATAPRAAVKPAQDSFKAATGTKLKSKRGTVAAGEPRVSAATSGARTAQVVEVPAAASGGALKGKSRSGTYKASGAALKPADKNQSGTTGGKGVIDVTGPRGSGSGGKGGRKTILDYGSGNGGRGGGLAGKRTRLVEPPTVKTIAGSEKPKASKQKTVSEAALGGKGVNVTISGQIQGRKILQRVAPVYSEQATAKGWEGIVAVHFTVLADGRVKDNVYFDQTSVHRDLNQAAMAAIKQFRFAPLPSDQAAIEQWGVITIVFRLN